MILFIEPSVSESVYGIMSRASETGSIGLIPSATLGVTLMSDNESLLVEALKKGNDILETINNLGLDIKNHHSQIQFSISINDNYFASIAKIRALKLLWQNVLTAWDKDLVANSPIEVHLTPNSQTEEDNYNKIKATTQAMSAVIGGADRLYIYPSDAFQNENGTTFSRRIALNVHHLLEQESYLDRVIDPSAGSYFIEELTNRIAEKAWQQFQNQIL